MVRGYYYIKKYKGEYIMEKNVKKKVNRFVDIEVSNFSRSISDYFDRSVHYIEVCDGLIRCKCSKDKLESKDKDCFIKVLTYNEEGEVLTENGVPTSITKECFNSFIGLTRFLSNRVVIKSVDSEKLTPISWDIAQKYEDLYLDSDAKLIIVLPCRW